MSPSTPARIPVDLVRDHAVSPRSVLLRFRASAPLAWHAGQHLFLFVGDAPGIPYSIASAHDPRHQEFELLVSSEASAEMLLGLRSGQHLSVSPPRGEFVWRHSPHGSLFVGMGTGLSPLRAMLQAARLHDSKARSTLLVGVRTLDELWWRSEFETSSEPSSFALVPTLSRAPHDWLGRRGRVQDHLAEIAAASRGFSVYLCGSPVMVSECARLLTGELGFAPDQVFSEAH